MIYFLDKQRMTINNLDKFIAAQLEVVIEDGLDSYLPTLWFETDKRIEVNVLVESQDGDDFPAFVRAWAQQLAAHHDYFLAFRSNQSNIAIVSQIGGILTERLVSIAA